MISDVLLDTVAHVVSRRGKTQVLDSRGLRYSKERSNGQNTHWVCVNKHISKCNARLSTGEDGKIVKFSGQHSHERPEIDWSNKSFI